MVSVANPRGALFVWDHQIPCIHAGVFVHAQEQHHHPRRLESNGLENPRRFWVSNDLVENLTDFEPTP